MSAIKRYSDPIQHSRTRRSLQRFLYSGLWAVQHPSEPFLSKRSSSTFDYLLYESRDGNIAPIYYLPRLGRKRGVPLIILTGPLFHPQVCLQASNPTIQSRRELGQDVYLITHRGHCSSNSERCTDHSFDAIAREDIPAALQTLRNKYGHTSFQWLTQGLGGVLALMWLAQSDGSSIDKLILLNTPLHFPLHWSRVLRTVIKPFPEQLSVHHLLRLHLALDLPISFTPKERHWLYDSASTIHKHLVEQLLQWMSCGHVCDIEGELNYLRAISNVQDKLLLYQTKSLLYGGANHSSPHLARSNAQCITDTGSEHFPLFSCDLSGLLAQCD